MDRAFSPPLTCPRNSWGVAPGYNEPGRWRSSRLWLDCLVLICSAPGMRFHCAHFVPSRAMSPVFRSLLFVLLLCRAVALNAAESARRLVFDGVLPEHKFALREIDSALPADWTGYTHLVMELRASSPQRWALWAYTADGPRRI